MGEEQQCGGHGNRAGWRRCRAKTLSETDVGGGINALQLMSGAAQPGMAA